ncbi:MAG: hypothetical protein IPL27_26165 [Lewinellaceae bacterium]|nr:hypothetical protein [Lewinellaceae bacterium]
MFKLIPLNFRTSHIAYLGGVAIHPTIRSAVWIADVAGNHQLERPGLRASNWRVAHINEKACAVRTDSFSKRRRPARLLWLKSENRYMDEVMMAYLLGGGGGW